MIGFGENLGSGFPLILSAWNEKHWLKPELIEQRELMQVKLVLSIETKDVGKGFRDRQNYSKRSCKNKRIVYSKAKRWAQEW